MKLAALLFLAAAIQANAAPSHWPRIVPLERSFVVDFTHPLFEIDIPVRAPDGAQLYLFTCRGGSIEALDKLGEARRINYVGPLSCNLNEGNIEEEGGLLEEDGSPHWHTRAQFHFDQLTGACARYPEFGRTRNFHVRGMHVRLRVSDVEPGKRLRMAVSITNDPRPTGSRSARPGYLWPKPGACNQVLKGKEPLMCRDASGRWREGCPD